MRAAVEQLGHNLRVEDHSPVGDTVQGVEEVDDVGHPVLEQVAQRPGAGGDEFPGVALLHVLGQDEDRQIRVALAHLQSRTHALVGEGRGQADVQDAEVGRVTGQGVHEADGVGQGNHDLVADLSEQPDEPLAQKNGVLADRQAHGRLTSRLVGPPSGLANV